MDQNHETAAQRRLEIGRPVFIVSSGRAGTTLLRTMLNAGGELHLPHESDFVARAHHVYAGRNDLGEADYPEMVKFFKRTSQNAGWGMDGGYMLERLCAAAPRTFAAVIFELVRAYLGQKGLSPTRWGLKTPVLIADLDKVFSVFPDAKVVHMLRDGRDVCLSYKAVHDDSRVRSFGPNGVVTSALFWVDGLRRVIQFEDRVFALRYEDLLDHPAEELRRLCTFLGISYTPSMHEDYIRSETSRHDLLAQHQDTIHAKIGQGLDVSNQGKYRSRMKLWDRFVFELLALPLLSRHHYPLEFPWLGHWIFVPLRWVAYCSSRIFNDWRYAQRGKAIYVHAKRRLSDVPEARA